MLPIPAVQVLYVSFAGELKGETILSNHNLIELRDMLSKEIKETYQLHIPPEDFMFEFGEVYK